MARPRDHWATRFSRMFKSTGPTTYAPPSRHSNLQAMSAASRHGKMSAFAPSASADILSARRSSAECCPAAAPLPPTCLNIRPEKTWSAAAMRSPGFRFLGLLASRCPGR